MEHVNRNIFNIKTPNEYTCTIWSYRVNHSALLIWVHKSKLNDESFYLNFEEVLYFEGPLKWKGADFCIGAFDECIKLLHRRGFKDMPDNELLDRYGLFVIELPNSEVVKILALKHIEKTRDIPPDFPWLLNPVSG